MIERARKRLSKRAKRGFRGYPRATVALYGPDDRAATKLTVGIVPAEHAEATDLRRWFSEGADVRNDAGVAEEVLAFIDTVGARSIVMTDRIIGGVSIWLTADRIRQGPLVRIHLPPPEGLRTIGSSAVFVAVPPSSPAHPLRG